MGLFSRKKKEVWRTASGRIACPGDSCKKDCDDSCPIYLNTQGLLLMQIGQGDRAISLYEEALDIAPDFYDAWNNLGGIYGGKGQYKKAYDCYYKAHELNVEKANPVYGLMLASRDLGRYEECLSWCKEYKKLADDGGELPILNEVNRRLGITAQTANKVKY